MAFEWYIRGTASFGNEDHCSVAGSQISGVMTAFEMSEVPSVEPPMAITRPSGRRTVLNFFRLNCSEPTLRHTGLAAFRSIT